MLSISKFQLNFFNIFLYYFPKNEIGFIWFSKPVISQITYPTSGGT